MVVDKAVKASVDGLNQMFKIYRMGRDGNHQIQAKPRPDITPNSIGTPILKSIDVTQLVDEIIHGTVQTPGGRNSLKTPLPNGHVLMPAGIP